MFFVCFWPSLYVEIATTVVDPFKNRSILMDMEKREPIRWWYIKFKDYLKNNRRLKKIILESEKPPEERVASDKFECVKHLLIDAS